MRVVGFEPTEVRKEENSSPQEIEVQGSSQVPLIQSEGEGTPPREKECPAEEAGPESQGPAEKEIEGSSPRKRQEAPLIPQRGTAEWGGNPTKPADYKSNGPRFIGARCISCFLFSFLALRFHGNVRHATDDQIRIGLSFLDGQHLDGIIRVVRPQHEQSFGRSR